jgi:hypothetical protein
MSPLLATPVTGTSAASIGPRPLVASMRWHTCTHWCGSQVCDCMVVRRVLAPAGP